MCAHVCAGGAGVHCVCVYMYCWGQEECMCVYIYVLWGDRGVLCACTCCRGRAGVCCVCVGCRPQVVIKCPPLPLKQKVPLCHSDLTPIPPLHAHSIYGLCRLWCCTSKYRMLSISSGSPKPSSALLPYSSLLFFTARALPHTHPF